MRRILISIFGVFMIFSAFGVGENIPTSKSYVDAEIAQKQDKIAANDGSPQVLTNTGTAGEYGTKGIYDANGAYATQTQNLVDAATMNAGVQNAIDSEFQCIEWIDPNDHTSDCLLLDVFGQTGKPSGKNLLDPSFMDNSTYGPITVNGQSFFAARILPTENGKTYTLSANLAYINSFYYYLGKVLPDGTYIDGDSAASPCRYMWYNGTENAGQKTASPCTFTASDNATYVVYFAGGESYVMRIKNGLTLSNYQMEEGSVATEYEPYKNLYLPSGN